VLVQEKTGDPFKLHYQDPAPKSNALIRLYHGILENDIGLQWIPLEMCPCFWIFYQTWIVGEVFNKLLFAIFIQQLDLGEDCSKLIINQLWQNSCPWKVMSLIWLILLDLVCVVWVQIPYVKSFNSTPLKPISIATWIVPLCPLCGMHLVRFGANGLPLANSLSHGLILGDIIGSNEEGPPSISCSHKWFFKWKTTMLDNLHCFFSLRLV
jgi:hypothetical protein